MQGEGHPRLLPVASSPHNLPNCTVDELLLLSNSLMKATMSLPYQYLKLSSLLILVVALLPCNVVCRPIPVCDCADYVRNVTKRYRPAADGIGGKPCGGFIDCEAPGLGCIYQDCAEGTFWNASSGPEDPVVGRVGICDHLPADWDDYHHHPACSNDYCIFIPPPPTNAPTASPTTPKPTPPPTVYSPPTTTCCPEGSNGMRAATAMGGSGCEGYVHCDNGQETAFLACGPGTLFDASISTCNFASLVDCTNSCMPSGGIDRRLNVDVTDIQLRGVSAPQQQT